ncbi:MAG: hypothetical protein Q9208_005742 [Pyrenodesmia sp. 3 TL-2023]
MHTTSQSPLVRYAKNHVMRNILNNDLESFAYYIQRMKDDLQHFNPIILPLSGNVADEVKQQTKEKNAILNDIEEFQFDTLPSAIDPQYTQRLFLEQFLYAVWLEDCYNPKLRETWLEAEGHLTRPPSQEFLVPSHVYARRKRPRAEETVTAFSPEAVLDDLLSTLRLYHSSRYKPVLEDPDFDVREFVLGNLAKPLHTIRCANRGAETGAKGLVLNIFEMLASLMFQTLVDSILDVYLKPEIKRQSGTKGLNLYLPLYQGHVDFEKGREINDDDIWIPLNDLTVSAINDPLIERSVAEFKHRAGMGSRKTKLSKALQNLIDGTKCKVTRYVRKSSSRDQSATISLRMVKIRLGVKRLKEYGVSWNDAITVRCELNPEVPHEEAYATCAIRGDPAERLAIRCTTATGISWYQQAKGDNNAQRANALVDELEGVKIGESRRRARRYIALDEGRESERKRERRGRHRRR